MIRLLLMTLILLTGCDKQGEDMTIFPFLEVNTTAFTTNVGDSTSLFVKGNNYPYGTIVRLDDKLYTTNELPKQKTRLISKKVGDKEFYSVDGEYYEVYKAINPMDYTTTEYSSPTWEQLTTVDSTTVVGDYSFDTHWSGIAPNLAITVAITKISTGEEVEKSKVLASVKDGDVVDYSNNGYVGHPSCPICKCVFEDGLVKILNRGDIPSPTDTGYFVKLLEPTDWGLVDVSVSYPLMPFDDKSYTAASATGHLYYDNIVSADAGEFSTVALYGMVADSYKVTFDNGEIHEGTIPLTEAGITRFIKADNTTSHCRIDLYRADGGKVSIGGIGISREAIDMGGTKFSADGTMNDNSPYETRKGGVVDYRPGITTFKDGVTTIIPIENEQTLENLRTTIKMVKRRRLAFDIGDAWHQKDDINVAMQVVARAESISYNLRSGGKDEPPEYIEVRWKIGESS